MTIDKSRFVDSTGRPLTQSLFLEIGYSDFAVYTLKEQDHEYKGVVYPSLKRLFLEEEDPIEYQFASKHLLNWKHWQRLNANKMLAPHFQEWREELEIKLRAQALKDIISASTENFQAMKWLADKGWDKRVVGRPKKDEEAQLDAIAEKVKEDFATDIARLSDYRK